MTAIGFLILAVMLIVNKLEVTKTDNSKAAAGFAVIIGALLFALGIARQLWQVMP